MGKCKLSFIKRNFEKTGLLVAQIEGLLKGANYLKKDNIELKELLLINIAGQVSEMSKLIGHKTSFELFRTYFAQSNQRYSNLLL